MQLIKKIGSFIKVEHSLFSLPLLFAGALLAPGQSPGLSNLPWLRLAYVILAGLGARACALALNRLIDHRIDGKNPRTAGRELPSGKLTPVQGYGVVVIGCALYLFAASALGPLCLKLSPLPLLVFVIYPFMKRFTWAAHFGVGLGLALAPLGGYIGVTDAWPSNQGPWWLAGFALCWVAGFDVLYSTLDEAFDRKNALHSISADFSAPVAQDMGLLLHALAFFCLAAMRWEAFAAKPTLLWLAVLPAGLLLAAEQRSGYSLDSKSPFFIINAWVGVAVLGYVVAGVY